MFAHDVAPGIYLGNFRIHTDVTLFCLFWSYFYYFICQKLDITPSTRQKVTFYSAMILLWAMSDWPFHDIAEESSYSVHMIQHLAYTFIFAPMVLLGTPKKLLEWVFKVTKTGRLAFILSRFLPALIINNVILVATHWPTVVNSSLENGLFHFVLHTIMILSSMLIWLPIVSPIKNYRYRPPVQMVYLFGQSVLPTIPASFLTFSKTAFYQGYFGKIHMWGINTLTDQLIAGLVMKLAGGIILWGFIIIIFFRWFNYHEKIGAENQNLNEANMRAKNVVK